MGVDLGRPDVRVAEQELDLPDVRPALQQMGRVAMAQRVDCGVDAQRLDDGVVALVHGLARQHLAPPSEEEGVHAVPLLLRPPGLLPVGRGQDGTHIRQIIVQGQGCDLADEDEALLAALAEDDEAVLLWIVG